MTDEAIRAIRIMLMIVLIVAAAKGVCELIAAHRRAHIWYAPEIRKVEPPRKHKTELIKTPWMLRDMRVVYQGPGFRTYEVILWCGTSGEHK